MFRTQKRLILPVLNALGPLLIILAGAQLLPLAIAYRDGEDVLSEFGLSATVTLIVGLFLLFSSYFL